MINNEAVKNLGELSRIEIPENEMTSLAKEIDSILGYVGQIQELGGDANASVPTLRNVFREDIPTNTPGEYTEKLLKNAPNREGNYLKVKNIL